MSTTALFQKGPCALLLAGLALVAPPCPSAQETDEEAPRRPGRVDTTAVEQVIQGFHPVYNTTYDVSLQRREWGQGLEFGGKYTYWDFKSVTDVSLGNDVFQDTERRQGSTIATINGRWIPRLPLTLVLAVDRRSQEGFNSASTNRTDLDLRTVFNQRFAGVMNNLTLTGGYGSNSGESENSGNLARTRERGLSTAIGWRATWNPLDNAKITSNINLDRERKNSRSEDVQDTGPVVLELPTTAARSTAQVDFDYDPLSWVNATLSMSAAQLNNTRFTTVSGKSALEAQDFSDRGFDLTTTVQGLRGARFQWDMGRATSEKLYDVASDDPVFNFVKDRSSDLLSDYWRARFTGRLLGFETESLLSQNNDDLDQRASFPNLTRARVWETKFNRKLSLKWDGRLGWRMDLRQLFQDTDTANQRQDFDEFRRKLDVGVGYNPNDRWRLTLGMNLDNFDRIEQNRLRANSTKTEETGSINAQVNYVLSPRVTIGQAYNIQARYENFLFNQANNRSRISRRIQTNLVSRIGNNVQLEFVHQWQQLKSGTFLFVNGVRTVFPASTTYTQDLTVRLEWQVTHWLSLRARENFVRRDDVREATGESVTLSRNLFLYEGFHIETDLVAGLRLIADGEYVRSNTRDSYWVLTSQLTKEF